MAAVTVRTLHHYDHLGLLKPTARSEAGYRLYGEADLERLEQIIVLKFLGLPLKKIRELLDQPKPRLPQTLRRQRQALEEKRRRLDMAIHAVAEAERLFAQPNQPAWASLKKIIEVIEMQNDNEWMMKYYQGPARAKLEERKKLWSPELQEQVSKQWSELIAEVNASLDEDPASPKAQALAARWQKLVEGFTGGDPDITEGLKNLYRDQANWPTPFQQQMQPFESKDAGAFIQKALAARNQGRD
jgi:MerR family transcriptional regulator, thiopeptide resistance regulator